MFDDNASNASDSLDNGTKTLSQFNEHDYSVLYQKAMNETWSLLDSIFHFQFKQTLMEKH